VLIIIKLYLVSNSNKPVSKLNLKWMMKWLNGCYKNVRRVGKIPRLGMLGKATSPVSNDDRL
jgi:hypothetical protein